MDFSSFETVMVQEESLARPGVARQQLEYTPEDRLEDIWVSGDEARYHNELLQPPCDVNIYTVARAMDFLHDHVHHNRDANSGWDNLEILPSSPFAMMGDGEVQCTLPLIPVIGTRQTDEKKVSA
jgi:hypothetical protein